MSMVSNVVTNAVTMFLVVVAVTVLPRLISRRPKTLKTTTKESGEKSIDVPKLLYWLIYVGALLFCILGIWVYLFSDEPIAGMGFIILCLIFIIPIAIFHFADTSVDWSDEFISGAKSGVSLKKNRIFWDDVVSAKFHPNQTIQIKDKSSKSVFWSVYYVGWYEIIVDLRRIRPDIDTSDFE